MTTPSIKEKARQILESLPDDATWDDVLDKLATRRAIEQGLDDVQNGRTITTDELRDRLNLDR